jgi:predicted ATPase
MSLARLWASEGRAEEARQLLGGVHGWFTEGFTTADLRQAHALMDALGGRFSNSTL